MTRGIVVDNKEAGARYAISEANIDPETEEFVRELKAGETIRGYVPKTINSSSTPEEAETPVTGETDDEESEGFSEEDAFTDL